MAVLKNKPKTSQIYHDLLSIAKLNPILNIIINLYENLRCFVWIQEAYCKEKRLTKRLKGQIQIIILINKNMFDYLIRTRKRKLWT
jgi:hypothetical protein